MDNIKKKIELDQKIIKLLKVTEVRHKLAETNHGPLEIMIRKDEENYTFLMDSTPVDEETNAKLLKYFDFV